MKQYFTGFFTAVCLTTSFFLFLGSQDKNEGTKFFDSIILNGPKGRTLIEGGSISMFDNKTEECVALLGSRIETGGNFFIANANGSTRASISTDEDGTHIDLYNKKENLVATLGPGGVNSSGLLKIYNEHEKSVVLLGTAHYDKVKGDGIIMLNDRYGDTGWVKTGKN